MGSRCGLRARLKRTRSGEAAWLSGSHPATKTGMTMWPEQVRYLAPEQIKAQEIDGRADLFALGVILTELVTGQVLLPNGAIAESDVAGVIETRCQKASRGPIPDWFVTMLVR